MDVVSGTAVGPFTGFDVVSGATVGAFSERKATIFYDYCLYINLHFNLTFYHICIYNISPISQGAATEEEHFLPLAVIDPLQQALLPPGPLSQFHFPQNDPHAISQHTLLLLG